MGEHFDRPNQQVVQAAHEEPAPEPEPAAPEPVPEPADEPAT